MSNEPRPVTELVGTEPEALPAGVYHAELVAIEQATTTFGERLRWRVAVPSADDFEVHGWSSLAITPKSKGGDWVEVIIGRRLARAEVAPVSELIGRTVGIVLTVDEESGYNRLQGVVPAVTPAAQPAPAAQADNPDYQEYLRYKAEREAQAAEVAKLNAEEPPPPVEPPADLAREGEEVAA